MARTKAYLVIVKETSGTTTVDAFSYDEQGKAEAEELFAEQADLALVDGARVVLADTERLFDGRNL